MFVVADEALGTFFLVAKYIYVLLFAVWAALVYRFARPGIVVVGAVVLCVYAYVVIQASLGRPYALFPGTDRAFNVAMVATAATGHSPFESYQVGFGDHEPWWKWSMSLLSFGNPENVITIYLFLTPVVTLLLGLSLYFGFRESGTGESPPGSSRSRWELALIVYSVLLLSSAPIERSGVFDPFWAMTLLLKPNHVLGFVLIPIWFWLFDRRTLAATAGAAVVLALLSWVFLLHWAYLTAGLAVYPIVAKLLGRDPEWRRAWLMAAFSLVAAVPYVVFLFENFPPAQTTVGRHIWESTRGFREGYWNVFAVGYEHGVAFLLSLVGIGVMLRRRLSSDVVWLSLVAGCVGVWLAYLVGFAIRKTVEPEEFYFYTRFVLAVAAGTGAYFVVERAVSIRKPPMALSSGVSVLLIATLPLSFPYWWNPPKMDRYYERSRAPIPERVERFTSWARDETDRDAVFVAGARTAGWVAALAGRRVLLTGGLRPPNDFERRHALMERMLLDRDREAFREVQDDYHVSHFVLDAELTEEYGADLSRLEALPWLETAYRDDGIHVMVLTSSDGR